MSSYRSTTAAGSVSAYSDSENLSVSVRSISSRDDYEQHGMLNPQRTMKDMKVAESEQKAVARSKIVVILVLVAAVAAVTSSVFLILSNEEKQDFNTQFENYANQIIAVAQQNAQSSFEVIEAFSVSITSYAKDTGKEWPFVTMPDFAARAHRIADLAHTSRFAMAPIVESYQLQGWTNYSVANRAETFRDDIEYLGLNTTAEALYARTPPNIYNLNFTDPANPRPIYQIGPGPYAPYWQGYPLPVQPITSYNILDGERSAPTIYATMATKAPTLNYIINVRVANEEEVILSNGEIDEVYESVAESVFIQPIFEKVANLDQIDKPDDENKKIVGILWAIIDWQFYFQNLLPDGADGIVLVLQSSCNGDAITYEINGMDAEQVLLLLDDEGQQLGGDAHDPKYDDMKIEAPFVSFDYDAKLYEQLPEGTCVPELSLHLYPSQELEDVFVTNRPTIYAFFVVLIFAFTTVVFIIYDYTVKRRQQKVMARVARQDQIVSNMFPTAIRDRLYGVNNYHNHGNGHGNEKRESIKKALSNGNGAGVDKDNNNDSDFDDDHGFFDSGILAELYPSVTLIFADIAGFTAWSSAREPHQVFKLLETIYGEFDKIAYQYGVFKVETVGDCYVGACGLPEPADDHVIKVAKFARKILEAMGSLTKKLEVSLGPDTTELKLRIGIHSGQVTAGVLRGERSRFQLFGDAVNVASRMESTSLKNHIQISEATANLLCEQGKQKWTKPREETIAIKGKGNVTTFWLKTKLETKRLASKSSTLNNIDEIGHIGDHDDSSTAEIDDDDDESNAPTIDGDNALLDVDDDVDMETTKMDRLVQWHTEILGQLLQQIVAARTTGESAYYRPVEEGSSLESLENELGKEGTVLEEFIPIISLPQFDTKTLAKRQNPKFVQLSEDVKMQLHDFLTIVSSMYKKNPFHNFQHASHVTASVRKLLTRIVSVDEQPSSPTNASADGVNQSSRNSYGITNDPITQFAVVFSAIIHDVDHPGVPNVQLVKEQTRNAEIYKGKSVAEQNSVDLAWDVLMQPEFADLRACIYSNKDELRRFRQLVVNTVMATDICDKELGALRKARWAEAFSEEKVDSTTEEEVNRKATIVIEHLIQASDVAHTMQHWHIYKQWNQRLFNEMYAAYKEGRADKDPSEGWYEGEIGFFDFYVIPLARKLFSCGVFGVSSHEYLNYAQGNRDEWERRGQDMVKEYLAALDESKMSK